jgi:PAS domain S-box-containing protein
MYQHFVELLPHLVWTCRANGACEYLSPQWIAYTGIPEEQQLGFGWLEQLHPDDREVTARKWQRAVETKGDFDVEFRIRRRDGIYRWFKTRAVPDLDDRGAVVRWFGTNTDIQELRDAQAALQDLHDRLEDRVRQRTEALERVAADLRATSTQFRRAEAIAHTGSWSLEVATGHVHWSDELFRIVRIPVAETAPDLATRRERLASSSSERLQLAVARAIEQGEPYELLLELAPDGGRPRWAMARGEPERAPDGSVARLYGTVQDITELVHAQQDRDRALERMALATEAGGIGVWDWEVGPDRLSWDAQMYALYGLPPGTPVRYEDFLQLVAEPDRERARAHVSDALAGVENFAVTFRIRPRTGGERHVRAMARVYHDAQGTPLRMVGVNMDVTAQAEAEALRQRVATLLSEFVRHAPVAIAMVDRELRYVEASDRWMTEYGLERDAVIGRSHYDVFPHIPERWRRVHQASLRGEVHHADADAFEQPDGSTMWLQWEVRPWYEKQGEVGGLLFFTRDITEQMRLQLALGERSAALERSNQDLRQFAYAASHDLQEPLRAVAGCAQLFASRYATTLDAEGQELIRHMVEGSTRMKHLIEDLLAYSRVESHGTELAPVDAVDAVSEAILNLRQAVRESHAEVVVAGLPAVYADRRQLTQLFQNLLSNAIKYAGHAPPHITVTAEPMADAWLFTVRDRGIGIPPDARERVFAIFQRLHGREEYPGTGVGLALCRRIVERHGGRIWIEPTTGPGTEVRFTLPARGATFSPPREHSTATAT